ncbi:hypothetical protein [Sphingomicrobium flavum]|uniref:hypothetical protein n=1 Tax=Sphingomicrobium flavum TaxID=1229164 RepID=UPI0021ADBC1A|nr:hypothetical protein [Sphingomicrobium flavum]
MAEEATTIASACEAADVPKTTGLRWLTLLEEQLLIKKIAASSQSRAVTFELTPDGRQKMSLLADGLIRLFCDSASVGHRVERHGEIGSRP